MSGRTGKKHRPEHAAETSRDDVARGSDGARRRVILTNPLRARARSVVSAPSALPAGTVAARQRVQGRKCTLAVFHFISASARPFPSAGSSSSRAGGNQNRGSGLRRVDEGSGARGWVGLHCPKLSTALVPSRALPSTARRAPDDTA